MSNVVATTLAIAAGKAIIRKVVRGKRVNSCPHCGGKVFIRHKTRSR